MCSQNDLAARILQWNVRESVKIFAKPGSGKTQTWGKLVLKWSVLEVLLLIVYVAFCSAGQASHLLHDVLEFSVGEWS